MGKPEDRILAKNAVSNVLKDGVYHKRNEIIKVTRLSQGRVDDALKELGDENKLTKKHRKKGYWQRTNEDISREQREELVADKQRIIAEVAISGPHQLMVQHSKSILPGLLSLSHYHGGRLDELLLRRDLEEMGVWNQQRGLEAIERMDHYRGMASSHLQDKGYEVMGIIDQLVEVRREMSMGATAINEKRRKYLCNKELVLVAQMDEMLAAIVASVVAGAPLKGECQNCPPAKVVMRELKEMR